MSIIEPVLDELRAARKSQGLTRYALALKAGLAQNAIRDMDEPDWSPSVNTVRKLERALGLDREVAAPPSETGAAAE